MPANELTPRSKRASSTIHDRPERHTGGNPGRLQRIDRRCAGSAPVGNVGGARFSPDVTFNLSTLGWRSLSPGD